MIKYATPKEVCQSRIKGVCPSCGGALEPIETVDNSGQPTFWAGCNPCGQFSNGVTPEVYQIAYKMVTEKNFWAYSHLKKEASPTPQQELYWTQSQVRGTCSVVNDVLKLHEHLNQQYNEQV